MTTRPFQINPGRPRHSGTWTLRGHLVVYYNGNGGVHPSGYLGFPGLAPENGYMSQRSPVATLATLRRLLLALLLAGIVGTSTELLLIGHDEDVWQVIPLAVLGLAMAASLVLSVTVAVRPAAATTAIRLFQAAMVLLILSGGAGSILHYRASMEFKREMDPSLNGFALFSNVIQSKAPPTMAPGTLALLGLLGLACVFRLDIQDPSPTL
jgi:hypothetical protein